MTEAAIFLTLYLIGFAGLNAMSRDFSDAPRSRKTWVALITWPIAIPLVMVEEFYDWVRERNQ